MIKRPSMILSPLPFYDTVEQQHRNVGSTFNARFCLYASNVSLIPFQINIQYKIDAFFLNAILIYEETGQEFDITSELGPYIQTGSWADRGISLVGYTGGATLVGMPYGRAYLKIDIGGEFVYSEVMTLTEVNNLIKIEYYNQTNLYADAGIVLYDAGYKNRLYLAPTTEISKPEYNFVQEGSERAGKFYPSRRMVEKIFSFSQNAPQFFCDSLALVGVSDFVEIITPTETYDVDQFMFTADFTASAIAVIQCEFHTAAIIHRDAQLVMPVWRIRGRVVNEGGIPLSGVAVQAGMYPNNWTALTDSMGVFVQTWVAGATPLSFNAQFSLAGYVTRSVPIGPLNVGELLTPSGQELGDFELELAFQAVATWEQHINRFEYVGLGRLSHSDGYSDGYK